mmetsp:Transcript_6489/g.16104  ORF Transcript_6489/g.16104 Transcript_6489/m.16104 type:complete len:304 (-) Transcript_6489:3933-4844(-)|eukprot:CAMPEP_0113915894 /NCGR_PEP_ID=MMETSP0780_2-20120614/31593_1 /TAXON_ID=652834 /ORGANISM="Palpitomonas bilix" /LENGTH=303 /DNA_ID=CAMNT_0000914729 /DNA_START=52 /DNA_END=963 /DNA_ORIENTATION=+ /assembly_acc=CAM_ASM_000599
MAFGSKTTAEEVSNGIDMTGKTVLVTGSNTGIGKETARVLAMRGATVIMACRSSERGEAAVKSILEGNSSAKVEFMQCDLGSLKSVKSFAEEYEKKHDKLDILINNAGVMACPRALTTDGLESQVGVNHIGHFYLVQNLRDVLKKSEPARVVVLSSSAHQMARSGINFDDYFSEKSYSRWGAYGQAKLSNLLFAKELDRQFREEGVKVTVNAVHPGVINTELGRSLPSIFKPLLLVGAGLFGKSIPQGAATSVFAATSPIFETVGGQYLADCQISACSQPGMDMEMARKLWVMSEQVVKEKMG